MLYRDISRSDILYYIQFYIYLFAYYLIPIFSFISFVKISIICKDFFISQRNHSINIIKHLFKNTINKPHKLIYRHFYQWSDRFDL